MELNSLFTIDDLRNVESFLREVDSLDEAIIIKDNRPMYRVIRIGSPCDRWVEEKRNTRGQSLESHERIPRNLRKSDRSCQGHRVRYKRGAFIHHPFGCARFRHSDPFAGSG